KETTPARTAMGTARSSEPVATVVPRSLIAHLGDRVEEVLVLHGAEGAGGDAALRIDDQRGRDGGRGDRALEGEEQLALVVEDARVPGLDGAVVGLGRRLLVLEVDPDEPHALGLGD